MLYQVQRFPEARLIAVYLGCAQVLLGPDLSIEEAVQARLEVLEVVVEGKESQDVLPVFVLSEWRLGIFELSHVIQFGQFVQHFHVGPSAAVVDRHHGHGAEQHYWVVCVRPARWRWGGGV